jgi:uncharacterized protein (TIGR00299 family) protein
MKTMYIECNMGAAGDMLMAALLELLPNPDGFIKRMNQLGIPGVTVSRETSVKCGITGTHIRVMVRGKEEESLDIPMGHGHHHHDHGYHHHGHSHGDKHAHEHIHDGHDHHHMDMHHHEHVHDDHRHHHVHDHHHTHDHEHVGMAEIEDIVNDLPLSDKVKGDVLAVYGLIAEAESKAHGKPVEAVHFHEVGMMDAVADIVGVCLLMEELAPQRVIVSPIHVGSGQVKCAHGILPVPAPATAYLLKGVPTYGGRIEGELCTPTGAALLKYFADDFGDRPVMATESIGYGMGKKDFPAANCVRIFLGETKGQDADIIKVECNLDDMTGEELGFALQVLMKSGALDAYIVPVQMKKSRPGHILVCLCRSEDEKKIAGLMLKHTTTFGVRVSRYKRYTLDRTMEMIDTSYGQVSVKIGTGFDLTKSKAEYEDLARLARENDISILEVKKHIK